MGSNSKSESRLKELTMRKNPSELNREELEKAVREAVAGCTTVKEAEQKLHEAFWPIPNLWIVQQEKGFSVLMQPRMGGHNISILCW